MKKFSLILILVLCLTVGSVYATWTYTKYTDVMDEAVHKSMNLGKVESVGSYGAYEVDISGIYFTIDPKAGTTHTTALYVTGEIVITFTPNPVAPQEVKNNGVASTFEFSLGNNNWLYEGQPIIALTHDASEAKHAIAWEKQPDGTFKCTLDAAAIAGHFELTEFVLDTKVKYDAYNTVLGQGQITITVSDGQTSQEAEQQ